MPRPQGGFHNGFALVKTSFFAPGTAASCRALSMRDIPATGSSDMECGGFLTWYTHLENRSDLVELDFVAAQLADVVLLVTVFTQMQ